MTELEECLNHLSLVRGSKGYGGSYNDSVFRNAIIWLLERQVQLETALDALDEMSQKETPDSQKSGAEGGNCK